MKRTIEHDDYPLGPRSTLRRGDVFRAYKGPVYKPANGPPVPMAERGRFRFLRYCENGAKKWVEALALDAAGQPTHHVVLWVGRPCPSPVDPRLRRRPYQLRPIRTRKARP